MRRIFVVIIVVCIAYFFFGWIAVLFNVVTRDDYYTYAGIVGSFASVAGLVALIRPAITQSDLRQVELGALKSMAETAQELKILQEARSKTVEEIGGLELRRKEMELLVKKASLALFLREQHAYLERRVIELISKDQNLHDALERTSEVSMKLRALNEEINNHPDVDQLLEIIASAERRSLTLFEFLYDSVKRFNKVIK